MGLSELKAYLRIDYDDDDAIIRLIRDAVIEEMEDLIPKFDKKNLTCRQKILICMYAKEIYDNRDETEQTERKVRFAARSMMLKERLK